eukprot:scaffold912_cov187-Ochromonas_danica.AAC.38
MSFFCVELNPTQLTIAEEERVAEFVKVNAVKASTWPNSLQKGLSFPSEVNGEDGGHGVCHLILDLIVRSHRPPSRWQQKFCCPVPTLPHPHQNLAHYQTLVENQREIFLTKYDLCC